MYTVVYNNMQATVAVEALLGVELQNMHTSKSRRTLLVLAETDFEVRE